MAGMKAQMAERMKNAPPEQKKRMEEMMGRMGGEAGMQEAAGAMAAGRMPWTAEAKARLETVPEFMRHMTQQIAEDVARERGHMEVNVELFQKVEALGEDKLQDAPPLPWTDGAQARLRQKIAQSPAIAMDFVADMVKRDTDERARELGFTSIDEAALTAIWDAPLSPVSWSDEAWKRLLTAPDFVRSGIRKAAERRARKLGLKEIDSEHLTMFRNEAMMKAVKRIRELGFTELTFDAFEAAKDRIRLVSLNPEAQERLDRIRRYFADERAGHAGDTLGPELMRRFRAHLADPAGAPLDTSDQGTGA
jgi:hypothetical protein